MGTYLVHHFLVGRLRFGPVQADSMEQAARADPSDSIDLSGIERKVQQFINQDYSGNAGNQFEWAEEMTEVLVDPVLNKDDPFETIDYDASNWFTSTGERIVFNGETLKVAQASMIHARRALDLLDKGDVEAATNTLRNFLFLNSVEKENVKRNE